MTSNAWETRWGWFAVRTVPRQEMAAAKDLRDLGFRAFVPVEIVKVRKGRGNTRTKPKEIERPFFNSYLFTQCTMDIQSWLKIRNQRHVCEVLSTNAEGIPTPVPDRAMEHIIAAGPFREPGPKPGEMVKLSTGPYEGLIKKIESVDRDERITVMIHFMGADRPVKFKLSEVERLADGSAAQRTA